MENVEKLDKEQFNRIVECFGDVGQRIATMNGLVGTPPMTEDARLLALKLNSVFSQFVDQSRIGRLEVYGKKDDWIIPGFIGWGGQFGWKKLFRALGLGVFERNIDPKAAEAGADFALCAVSPRQPSRELGFAELARLEALMKGVKDAEALKALSD